MRIGLPQQLLIVLLVTSFALLPTFAFRSEVMYPSHACEVSVDELLAMDPVTARDVLLSLHFDVCVTQQDQSLIDNALFMEGSNFEEEQNGSYSNPSWNSHNKNDFQGTERAQYADKILAREAMFEKEHLHSINNIIRGNLNHTALQYSTLESRRVDAVDQREELMSLYASTNGDGWINNSEWNTQSPICYWYGVSCGYWCHYSEVQNNTCPVIYLVLRENGLQGYIPDINLPFLLLFDIAGNQVGGTIPSFKGCPLLDTLYMDNNKFTGTLPDFSDLFSLKFLMLYNNEISGSLPNWNHLANLEYLFLYRNTLSGSVQLLNYPVTLQNLDLSGNNLQGTLQSNFYLPSLAHISLYENQLNGTIPDFSSTQLLKMLYVSSNQFSGTIPNFSKLLMLEYFILDRNKLSGSVPGFSQLVMLQYLVISSNELSGTIPEFRDLVKLTYLDISGNELTGTIPSLRNLSILEDLRFSSNKLSGTVPTFPTLSKLRILEMYNNQLSGSIPDFKGLGLLEVMYFSKNLIYGTIPDFGELKMLQNLDLSSNHLNGTIPDFSNLLSLYYLDISSNDLNGRIPDFSNTANLWYLDLSSNHLSGLIPNFSNLVNLERYVDVSSNQLTGTLPNFRNVPILHEFWAHSNQLNGAIPDFPNLKNMGFLVLSTNQLNGTLPNFSKLYNLKILDIFGNRLTGTIPNFNKLKRLEHLNLNGNRLEGTIPDFNGLNKLQFLSLDNNMLTGQIPLFSNIPNVIVLSLGNNRLTGTIPNFPNLKEVVSIHLHNNLLTGTIPVFSTVLVKISDLVLDSNQLTGTIPDFSSVPSLLNIQISNNSLHGNIPNFRENSKLKLFDASSNLLTGTLPSFEVCLELKMIDVSNNYLVSVLQQSLPSLQTLSISNNRLEGELPDLMNPSLVSLDLSFNTLLDIDLPQWPSLKKLRVFDAYNCSSLKSKLPQGMDGYTEISDMSLSHSMMTVNISESIAMLNIGKRSPFSRNSSTPTNDESLSLGRKVLESILPATLKPTDRYELDNITDLYRCSTISVRNPSILRPQIDMPSSYYEKIFCQCLPGYFGFQGNCVKCPPDCDCPDGKTLRECYPSPSVKNISRVFPCPNPNACYYRITDDNWIDLIDQKFDFPCEEGYDGRVCSKCAENFILEGSNCNECDVEFTVSTTVVLIIIFSAGFFASVATEWFGFFDFDSAQLDIFLFYTQVIQIITAVVKISISSRVIRTISSLITFKIPSLECLQKLEPAWVLAANLLRIPLIFGVGFVVYLVARKVKPTIRVKVVSLIFVFLETSYFSVAADVLSAYGCTVYDEPLGKWYLTFHPWMQCYPFTTDYRNLLIVTIPGLLFLVGYPLLLWQIAKVAGYETYSVNNFPDKDGQIDRSGQEKGSGMEEMDEPEDGSVGDIVTFAVNMYKVHAHNGQRYASGRSADSAASGVDQGESQRGDSASNPEQVREEIPTIWKDFVVIQSMNITSIYEKRCFWWVTVRIIQSLLFGFSVNIIPYTSPGILYFTLFAWIQISIFLQNAYSPYLHDSDDLLAVVSFNVLYISFFCALLTQFLQDVEWVAYLIIGVNSLFVLYFVYTFVPAIKSKLARKKTTQVIPKELELKAIHMDEKNEKAKSKANAFEQAHQKVREYSSNPKK